MKLIDIILELLANIKYALYNMAFIVNKSGTENISVSNSTEKCATKKRRHLNNKHMFIITNSDNEIVDHKSPISSTHFSKTIGDNLTIMDSKEFRVRGKEIIDYIANYRDTILTRPCIPNVTPNYLRPLLPEEAPMYPEKFERIMKDFEDKILLGMAHWNHPRFHAYFPSGNSYPTLIGDMLSGMVNCIGFSWASGPSCTELEIIVLDWFAKALGLPTKFLSTTKIGGGVLQGSASDIIHTVLLAARYNALEKLNAIHGLEDDQKAKLLPLLVAYCSRESHSCVEKAAKLCMVRLRILDVNDEGAVTPETLEKALSEDEANGLTPFFYSSILGSTSQTAFDDLTKLGPICRKRPDFWLHVDGAYAGSAFICPEMRYLMDGMEHVNSFNVNPNKWLLALFDCSVLFVDDCIKLTSGLIVDPLYLKHENDRSGIIDRRHFHVALSRRFRALKLWLLFRLYGISGLQNYIRNHIKLAKYFEGLVRSDDRFEVLNIVRCGLVCFRIKGENILTEELLADINHSQKLHMVPTIVRGNKYVIRFVVNYEHATQQDMDYAWSVITKFTTKLLALVPEIKTSALTHEQLMERRINNYSRSVSMEEWVKRPPGLYDGATPIMLVDDDDEARNVFDDQFKKVVESNASLK